MRIVILMLAALLVVTGIGCGDEGPKGPSGRDRGGVGWQVRGRAVQHLHQSGGRRCTRRR